MQLSDVRFQDAAQSRLQRALRSDRMPHAYLFVGPTGVGKEMLATRLARVLLCSHARESSAGGLFASGGDPPDREQAIEACGACDDCVLFDAGNHPDFHRIHRMLARYHPDASVRSRKATVIGIDVIRHFLVGPIGSRPARGRAKVFVVVEADRLSEDAQNALLKTLEEPPGHSFLILLADSVEFLLPTTRSRCQQVSFGPLPTEFIVEQLCTTRNESPHDAAFLAELAQGSLGMALRFGEMNLARHLPVVLKEIAAAAGDPVGSGRRLNELAKELTADMKKYHEGDEGDINAARDAQLLIFAMVAAVLRDVQRLAVGAPAAAIKGRDNVRGLADGVSPKAVREAIRAVSRAEQQVVRNVNTNLIFDALGILLGRAFEKTGQFA